MAYWYDFGNASDYYHYDDDYDWDSSYAVEEPCPLEFLPFRDLADACTGFLDTQWEYPLYNATHYEFLDLAEGATGCMQYEREMKFHKFLVLPAELRLKVYEDYLKGERDSNALEKHLHTDEYNKPCCIWRWPEELIVCDRHSGNELPTAKYAPWLPALAFANKQVLGEVTICMLESTEWFDFKYEEAKPFKIVIWFADFLSTFPKFQKNGVETTEGFAAIKRINFPHEHRYNENLVGKVIDEQNPDIQLMLKCTELETIAMAFNWRKLITRDPAQYWMLHPRDLEEFLDFFQFRPMLEHKTVKNVYLEGVYPRDEEGETMKCLYDFGKWIIKGFKEKQGRDVEVYIHKRWKIFEERAVGEKLVLEDEVDK